MSTGMTWPTIVASLQGINALIWLAILFQFHMAPVRIFTGRGQERDAPASWLCVFAAVQTGFMLHWLLTGQDDVAAREVSRLQVWSALYFVLASSGLGMSYTLQNNINRQQHGIDFAETNRRARRALVLWAVVAGLCFMLALVAASAETGG